MKQIRKGKREVKMWFEVKSSFGLMHGEGFGTLTLWMRKGLYGK